MNRRLIAIATLPLAILLSASSCEPVDCNEVLDKPPSAALQKAASEVVNGEAVEVEVEVEDPATDTDVECVVQDDRWVNVTDDTA